MSSFYYHATSIDAARLIQKQGFKCSTCGMNGAGVYFADNPMSALFKSHTLNPGAIIVAKVNVGRKAIESCSHRDWNLRKIEEKGFDVVQTNCKSGPEICVYEPWRITIVEIYYLKEKRSENNHSTHMKYFNEFFPFKTIEVHIKFNPKNDKFLYDASFTMKNIGEEWSHYGCCNIGNDLVFKDFTLY